MKDTEFLLMLFSAFEGKIDSKTKIQKMCYFLSIFMEMDLGFKPHYYGPYSPRIETALNDLVGMGFLTEDREYYGFSGGFEAYKSKFALTSNGDIFSKQIDDINKRYKKNFETFSGALKKIPSINYFTISIAAKIYFIVKEENNFLTTEEIIKKAKHFKWEIKPKDITDAIEILKTLKLVTVNA